MVLYTFSVPPKSSRRATPSKNDGRANRRSLKLCISTPSERWFHSTLTLHDRLRLPTPAKCLRATMTAWDNSRPPTRTGAGGGSGGAGLAVAIVAGHHVVE